MAAGFNFQNAPPTGSNSWYSDPTFQSLYNSIVGNTGAGGFQWTAANTTDKLNQYVNDFTQQFTNATGQAPSAAQINQFLSQAVSPVGGTQAGFAGTDPNAVAQQYVPQAFQPQIQQHGQDQMTGLGNQISGLATQVGNQTASQLSNPSSPLYQEFSGMMNNQGITPSSGAFQSGLGGTIGNAASGTIQSLLQSLGGGAIGGNMSPSLSQLSGMGQQAGAATQGYNQQLNDWFMQSGLGEKLFNESQPTGFQTALGEATGAANAFGNLLQGGAKAYGATWICTNMVKREILTEGEVHRLHKHLFRALWRRPFKFIGYFLLGKLAVLAGNRVNVEWSDWRESFYDNVIRVFDPADAVDLYASAFWNLVKEIHSRFEWEFICWATR